LNIYAIHHSKEYWGENVEEWIPERWLNVDKLPKDAFFPFSAGKLVNNIFEQRVNQFN